MVRLRDRGAGRGAEESADAAEIKCLITASQVNFISSQAEDRYLSLDYVNSARLVYVIVSCAENLRDFHMRYLLYRKPAYMQA